MALTQVLIKAAGMEMQKTMSLNPPFDPNVGMGEMIAWMREAIPWINPKKDKFTAETNSVIEQIRIDEEEKPKEEDEDESDLLSEVKNSQRLRDLKDIATEYDEFKPLRGKLSSYKTAEELKAAMIECYGKSTVVESAEESVDAGSETPVDSEEKETTSAEAISDKKEKKKAPAGPSKVEFYTPLIAAGKYTVKELIEIGIEEYPHLTKSTLQTFLTDSKNAKYSKFNPIVVADEKGILSFKKE